MRAPKASSVTRNIMPVAEYVRMSTDHQRYSMDNQRALIQAYAVAHDMLVVRSFMDAGKSGVTLRGREGLREVLAEVVSGSALFKAILVYDVSRWGRFQDADESAHYEFLCRRAGIAVIYCAEQFAEDTTPLGNVLKSMKRAMAGEFSRELGVKVAAGKAKLGGMGFRVGGIAGYGLRRRILVDGVTPGMLLMESQRKSIQNDRVTLVPGPAEEVALVLQIYLQYVHLRRSERDIAAALNEEGHSFYGRPWTRALVRTILTNEKYIGNNLVGVFSARLFTRQVTNPPEKWTRCEGAFEAIVPRYLFDAAEVVRRFNEKGYFSREDIVKGLRRAWKREGRLSAMVIHRAPDLPTPQTIARRFGSIGLAYAAAGYTLDPRYWFHGEQRQLVERRASLQKELVDALTKSGVIVYSSRPGIVTIDSLISIEVRVSRLLNAIRYNAGWRINYQRRPETDLVVAARLKPDGVSVQDFMLVPRGDLSGLPEIIRKTQGHLVAQYVHKNLDAVAKRLADSLRRQEVGNAERPRRSPSSAWSKARTKNRRRKQKSKT